MSFLLSKSTPGDAISQHIGSGSNSLPKYKSDLVYTERAYRRMGKKLHLDKPTFYFNFTASAFPDTLYRILQRDKRIASEKLIAQYGNWDKISAFQKSLKKLEYRLFDLPDSISSTTITNIRNNLLQIKIAYKDDRIKSFLKKVRQKIENEEVLIDFLSKDFVVVEKNYVAIKRDQTPSKLWMPAFRWYGADNQYHHWITSFLVGDFGTSYQDGRPVVSKIKSALSWTLLLNVISIFLAYLISIPLGVFSAAKENSRFDKTTTLITFLLYSLPSFWIATILVVFFTTAEYGAWTNIFPSIGIGKNYGNVSAWTQFWDTAAHLILPVFCITYASIAFISRQMRGGMLEAIGQDYIRTAKAKGVNKKNVIWKHAFRNSLFPIITLFALVFPATLAGSVIIEVIFNIPGMGRLAYESIFAKDWPIVYTILMLAAILTIIGNLLADMLYAYVDPRVTYTQQS